MAIDVWQVNLQQHFGGGEVFTRFLSRALSELGCRLHLLVSPKARFWHELGIAADFTSAADAGAVPGWLPQQRCCVLTHGPLPSDVAQAVAQRHFLCGVAHMPLFGRNPESFAHYHLVIPVSGYVLESLEASPSARPYGTPLYGVADLDRFRPGRHGRIQACSPYDWDERKLRDRLLGLLYPLYAGLRPQRTFERGDGITLGIVSRLTPIKQFPQLFACLAPVLARHPEFRLEIFGSGGYASVRDLRHALAPLGARVRFWGQQSDVAAVYAQLDYLMTGLPEKEALGLNVIEAQACGLPVLAVAAPPFTETVVEGQTGFFYRDPRQDDGADFERLLQHLLTAPRRLDPRAAVAHLERFGYAAFRERVAALLATIAAQVGEADGR